MNQYFHLFQLSAQFELDEAKLEQNYHVLIAQFHPDKFASASTFEQKQSLMMTSTINEAYRILKNPINRAAYLLKQHNIDADAPEHTSFSPEFLIQQMEWRETLQEAKDNQNQNTIETLHHEIQIAKKSLLQSLTEAFEQENFEDAAQLVRQGRFLDKLNNEILHSLS